jgi:hypothetical protein
MTEPTSDWKREWVAIVSLVVTVAFAVISAITGAALYLGMELFQIEIRLAKIETKLGVANDPPRAVARR